MADKKVTRQFKKEKETKNKVRYQEETDGDEAVGTLYLTKEACSELGNPENLSVEIKAA